MSDSVREWRLKALTPIWTGSVRIVNDREKIENTRLVTTGLLGSIRWWFEVLVRGLGGRACDPSKTQCQDRDHCVVCELFGCTGWARKFRFQVLKGSEGDSPQAECIQKDAQFRFRFVPLRKVAPEEWALLDLTLRLIAYYGAIGGKTVLKPSDETSRAGQAHHRDYGIVEMESCPAIGPHSRAVLEKYVAKAKWQGQVAGEHDFAWPSLKHFWCVNGRYLARQNANSSTFNRAIGRPEPKKEAGQKDSWLAGHRPRQNVEAESKKVFSFKDPPRTFGFVEPGAVELTVIKETLKQAWPDMTDDDVVTAAKILDNLCDNGTPGP